MMDLIKKATVAVIVIAYMAGLVITIGFVVVWLTTLV